MQVHTQRYICAFGFFFTVIGEMYINKHAHDEINE